jgi:uncharacterized protein YraI
MTRLSGLRVLLTALACAAALVGTATPAAADVYATVGNTDGDGLLVRAGPSTSTTALTVLATGTQVRISCQAYGTTVTNTRGFTSNLWDYLPAYSGYVSDAYMATGYDYRIPGVPLCGSSTGTLVPLQQNQGQVTQWEDCGPTSVVTAILALGRTPHEWSSSYPRAAIERARVDMGLARGVLTGGTNETQVNRAFATYGLSTWTSWNFDTILAHVRSGRPVVMAGNTRGLPWPTNVRDPVAGVPHFLTVARYDSATGEYLVLDPIAVNATVKRATRSTLWAYFDNYLGRAAVLT